jgi:hypothetical protein
MARVSHDSPSEVDAEQGQVIIDGPNGVAFSFTPDAAEETARRLQAGAAKARTQDGEASDPADP